MFNGILEKKISLLEEKVEEIRSWIPGSFDDFRKNSILRNAVERALQVSVEIVIDISERILALKNVKPGETSSENIKKLEDIRCIKSSENYVRMVQFRNFIVHRYEKIDPEILYDVIKNHLDDFKAFLNEITEYIRSQDERSKT